jgi:NAD-dependent deacetylase
MMELLFLLNTVNRMSMEKRLKDLLDMFKTIRGKMSVLTGAGISAESGIPTFRGPEGYWTIGSRQYRPEQMATQAMFRIDPWAVWSWYLYRRGVCMLANPNLGHHAVAKLETLFCDRFRLITQNVDGLHLCAGNTPARTYQVHGNIHYMRCARPCCQELFPIPHAISPKEQGKSVTEEEKQLLHCHLCGSITRPHVLWFDEWYDEALFRFESALRWAQQTDLLLVVGTSGATNLPMQIGMLIAGKAGAIFIDINPNQNPFRQMALQHPHGLAFEGKSGDMLPKIIDLFEERG